MFTRGSPTVSSRRLSLGLKLSRKTLGSRYILSQKTFSLLFLIDENCKLV